MLLFTSFENVVKDISRLIAFAGHCSPSSVTHRRYPVFIHRKFPQPTPPHHVLNRSWWTLRSLRAPSLRRRVGVSNSRCYTDRCLTNCSSTRCPLRNTHTHSHTHRCEAWISREQLPSSANHNCQNHHHHQRQGRVVPSLPRDGNSTVLRSRRAACCMRWIVATSGSGGLSIRSSWCQSRGVAGRTPAYRISERSRPVMCRL